MGQRIVTVDAFTQVPFAGNPAGVCLLERAAEEAWMRNVAREMNYSETAFLVRRAKPTGGAAAFDLRWFTPTAEVDLCGHATLASAHSLWEEGHVGRKEGLAFHTRSGVLRAERAERGGGTWIELDFPSAPVSAFKGSTVALSRALGAKPRFVGTYGQDYLFEVEREETVRQLSPDLGLLKSIPVRGVAVTAAASPSTRKKGYDFVSRFFAPRFGINEDPVTGSAHCGLGPFWADRVKKREVTGYQASSRGGTVKVRPEGDRVILGGQAVTVLRAELSA